MTLSPLSSPPSPWTRRAPLLAVLAFAGLLTSGCGDSEREITDVRRTAPAPDRANASRTTGWGYRLPDGWELLPPARGRELGFKVAGRDDALCTFSILRGSGGGLAANVNRWRTQMSLEAMTEEQIAELTRRRFLGEEAVEVDLEGRYVGMGKSDPIESAGMFGLIVAVENAAAFLKMVGPADVVAAERKSFDRLQLSLTVPGAPTGDLPPGHPPTGSAMPPSGTQGGMPPGHPPMTPQAPPQERPSLFEFDVPQTWVKQGAKSMRDVTFKPAGATKAECYISVLGGQAGGLEANINRWRSQMGKPALSPEQIAALPTADVLGGKGVFVTVTEGDFSGDSGERVEGAALLGFIVERADNAVFVKMRGPAADVLPEQAAFESFCKSLRDRE